MLRTSHRRSSGVPPSLHWLLAPIQALLQAMRIDMLAMRLEPVLRGALRIDLQALPPETAAACEFV